MPNNASSVKLDIGAYVTPVFSSIGVAGLAGGAGDNVEDDGAWHEVPDCAQGLFVAIQWTTTLANLQTFSLAVNLQDATDISGTGAADFLANRALVATVVATDPGGGGTITGVTKVRYPGIRSHRGFIRAQTTGDLDAGATDTFEYSVTVDYGGMRDIPALA